MVGPYNGMCIDPKLDYKLQGVYGGADIKTVIIDINKCSNKPS